MKRWLERSCLVLGIALAAAVPAWAQIGGRGSIQGTVADASGGALPAATVTATHLGTGLATTRQTSSAGVYALSPLAPGEYRVTVTLDGFTTFVREPVVVDALAVVGLNVTLVVGAVTQEVTVSADTTYSTDADAASTSLEVGRCVNATGDTDSTGAVTACATL